MSKESSPKSTRSSQAGNIADMWDAYSKSLEVWVKSFDAMQEAASNAFKLYLQGFEEATRQSNFGETKKYNELWQNISKQFEQYNPYGWSVKAWDDIWKNSGFTSFKSFTDYWQDMWKNFAKSAETLSQEALKQLEKQNTK